MTVETDCRALLEKYHREIYNDVYIDGELVVKGVRESKSRLDPILGILPRNPMVLDIGCHTGFFTIETARRRKEGVIVGMEANYMRAEIAGAVAAANHLTNVVILNNLFTPTIARRWGDACEAFHAVYFLNVLHHVDVEEILPIIDGAKRLAPQWVVETPDIDETTACGTREHRSRVLNLEAAGYTKQVIARTPTHTGKTVERPMFLFENTDWTKEVSRSHYCHNTPSKRKHVLKYDPRQAAFIHNTGESWMPGVNLGTMVALNMVYPTRSIIFDGIDGLIDAHDGPLYDVNLWNILITPHGLKLIDFTSKLEKKRDKASAKTHLKQQFDSLKKEGAKPLQLQNWKNWIKHVLVGLVGKYRRN